MGRRCTCRRHHRTVFGQGSFWLLVLAVLALVWTAEVLGWTR